MDLHCKVPVGGRCYSSHTHHCLKQPYGQIFNDDVAIGSPPRKTMVKTKDKGCVRSPTSPPVAAANDGRKKKNFSRGEF